MKDLPGCKSGAGKPFAVGGVRVVCLCGLDGRAQGGKEECLSCFVLGDIEGAKRLRWCGEVVCDEQRGEERNQVRL